MMQSVRISDRVVQKLLEMIVKEKYQPGDLIPSEKKLKEEFSVSRLICREAIAKLEGMGILRARHGKGVYIANREGMSLNTEVLDLLHGSGRLTVADLRQARLIIEPPLARFAAVHATRKERELIVEFEKDAEEAISELGILERARVYAEADVGFHQLVATASRNPILPMILKSMHEMLNRVRLEVLILHPDSVVRGMVDHRKIANAIYARDSESAEELMERHIRLRGAEFLFKRAISTH